jgi:isoleucyl-tRNA synthetase
MRDAEGKKMSKSIGNVINPWDMMDKYGADALRFWMYSINQAGDSKNFDEKTVDEIIKKVFNLVANVTTFYKTYEDKSQVVGRKEKGNSQNIIDQWIVVRMNQLIENVTRNMDAYNFFEPTREIREFIADLSQWYLRRSRDRFKGDDLFDKEAALATTKYVLLTLAKVMAPFTPFFAEFIYGEVGGEKESVHMESWPVVIGKIDEQLLKDMEVVRLVSSKGLEARTIAKINVRQPLAKLKIKDLKLKIDGNSQLIDLVKDEVNVKEVTNDSSIEREVELDLNLTPELKEEGVARELIRSIQDLRKETGLTVSDKAMLVVETDSVGQLFIEKNKLVLSNTTSLKDIKFEANNGKEIAVGEFKVKLQIHVLHHPHN